MNKPDVPAELDWVTERHGCSTAKVFAELKLGVKSDIDSINDLIREGVLMRFSFVESGRRFSVICEVNHAAAGAVDFTLSGDEILVGEKGAVRIQASLTLNSSGKCTLKVGDEELEQWQLRRKALERLFFDNSIRERYS